MEDEKDNGITSRLLVAVRVRPLSQKELSKEKVSAVARAMDEKTILVVDPSEDYTEDILRKDRPKEKLYAFDYVFNENASQMLVFDRTVRFLVSYVLQGFNATVFAYGATGAGKTFTMMGTESKPGIMALTLADLFNKVSQNKSNESCQVTMNYLEIYNENIRDLLSGKPDVLELREDSSKGVVVAGITTVEAHSAEEVMMFLRRGNRHRTQEPTGANEVSSRSHAVLQVTVTYSNKDENGNQIDKQGKLSMIDLAGSERAAETNNRGIRMIEGANINRSLLALGNCINALGENGKKGKYVNYRDSKLTRLLKDSLGGNCRTVMIANISPSSTNFDETINTLKYASRARTIKTKISQQIHYKYDLYNNAMHQLHADTSLRSKIAGAVNGLAISSHPGNRKGRGRSNTSTTAPPDSPGKWSDSMLSEDDAFFEAMESLEAIFAEQLHLRTRFLSAEEQDISNQIDQARLESSIDSLEKQIKSLDPKEKEKKKALEEELFQKKTFIEKIIQEEREFQALKSAYDLEMQDFDKRIKNVQHNLPKTIDIRSKQCIALLIRAHYLETDNLDLDQSYTLSDASLKQKESEIQLLYKLIQLYQEIVTFQLKERTTSIPKPLDLLLTSLKDLKLKLDLTRTDEEYKEKSRRQHQLNALNDRLSLRAAIPDFAIEHSKSTKSTKKQNILSAGLGKLFGKGNATPKRNTTLLDVQEVPSFIESDGMYQTKKPALPPILPKSETSHDPSLEKVTSMDFDGVEESKNISNLSIDDERSQPPPRNLAQQSEFSQSMQLLEKQVKELIKPTKHDYLEQFKQRSMERLAKLNAVSTPYSMKSDATNSQTLYDNSIRGSSEFSVQASDSSMKQSPGKSEESIEKSIDPKKAKVLDMFASKATKNALLEKAYGMDVPHKDKDSKHPLKIQPVLHTKKLVKSRRPTDEVKVQ